MTATIIKETTNGFNINHRKEKNFAEEFSAIAVFENYTTRECVTLRIYQTDSRAYACIWCNDSHHWYSGSGMAGGYGYHRASAAAQEAITKAGIDLSEDINGRGNSAIQEVVYRIAQALHPEAKFVTVHHAHA